MLLVPPPSKKRGAVYIAATLLSLSAGVALGSPCPTCDPTTISSTLVSDHHFESHGFSEFHGGSNVHGGLKVQGMARFNGGATAEADVTVRGTLRKPDGSPLIADPGAESQLPESCMGVLDQNAGATTGEYDILVQGVKVRVHCDMDYLGGGWTKAGHLTVNVDPLPLRGFMTIWDDLNLADGEPTDAAEPQFHLPMSHFSKGLLGGEDVEVLLTSPIDPSEKILLLGFANKCMWGAKWPVVASTDIVSDPFPQYCVPRSEVPVVSFNADGEFKGSCSSTLVGTSSNRKFIDAECAAQIMVRVYSTAGPSIVDVAGSMGGTFSIHIMNKLTWYVREHRKTVLAGLTAAITLPNLLNHFPVGPGTFSDVAGGLPDLIETGSATRVADKCGATSNGAVALTASAQYFSTPLVSSSELDLTASFAVSFWVRRTGATVSGFMQTLVTYSDTSVINSGWEVYMDTDTSEVLLKIKFTGSLYTQNGPFLNLNEWTHIAFGYERAATGGTLTLGQFDHEGRYVPSTSSTGIPDWSTTYSGANKFFGINRLTSAFGSRSWKVAVEFDDVQVSSGLWTIKHDVKRYAEDLTAGPGTCPM